MRFLVGYSRIVYEVIEAHDAAEAKRRMDAHLQAIGDGATLLSIIREGYVDTSCKACADGNPKDPPPFSTDPGGQTPGGKAVPPTPPVDLVAYG